MSSGNFELREPPLGVLTHQPDRPAKPAKTEETKPALQLKRRSPVHSVSCFQTSFVGENNSRTNVLRNLLLLWLKGTWWSSCLSLIPQTWEWILFKTEFTQALSWSVWMTCFNESIWAPLLSPLQENRALVFLHMCFYACGFLTFPESVPWTSSEHYIKSCKGWRMCSILNRGVVELFFQLTFSAQISSGMAGQRALLTSNPYSHSIPWQALS